MVWIEAELPRVACRACGVCVAQVPWARAGAGHTYDFDRQVAYLATTMNKSAVSYLMRIAWRTVGAIVARYWQDVEDVFDRFEDLTRIGIDEQGHFADRLLRIARRDQRVEIQISNSGVDGDRIRLMPRAFLHLEVGPECVAIECACAVYEPPQCVVPRKGARQG